MNMTPWLSTQEIEDLCEPLKQRSAQVTYLKKLGLKVTQKPNGSPLVLRSNVETVLGNGRLAKQDTTREPDKQALMLSFGRR